MYSIEAQGLTKDFKIVQSREGMKGAFRDLFDRQYRTIRAVDEIDLRINPGEIVGYIGENGAGKSTTIKMLTGILQPTSGDLKVNGYDPHGEREQFVKTIGVVFGQRSQLWWDLAVRESFRLLKKLYSIPDEDYHRHLNRLTEVLEMGPLLEQPVRKLSLGQRMRCELAAALIHQPRLLFLDEPTIGLDVLVKENIRRFLKQINEEYGTTILLTTHDLSDIEALSHRVVMLDKGKIIYNGGLPELSKQWGGGPRLYLELKEEWALSALQDFTKDISAEWQHIEGRCYRVGLTGPDPSVSEVLSRVVPHASIKEIRIEEAKTEDIVRRIYQEGVPHA
ncbi:ABC-2 type transport system ATP-binding protein [Marininema mesophilum]|uniref:ABC-2 type transport system ATP-binding protein n=1 Tax=Marininema mesophilum TaxID=1048340 RepID=A0A1H2WMB6_9BACL|nr:ATP-binding cassette domain-containing protein [Marininema mesophilum]SDW81790.1 ABC-2 type transport system ATP-binding protein [Marininema mesophilum]